MRAWTESPFRRTASRVASRASVMTSVKFTFVKWSASSFASAVFRSKISLTMAKRCWPLL